MKIRFMGLICHIARSETGNDDIAVLVKAPAHLPRLRVPKRHIFGNPPNTPGTDCDNLQHRRITFSLGAGVANRAALAGAVPRLSDFGGSAGTLHPNVPPQNATDPADSLETFVVLPAGTYGVEDSFPYLGVLPAGATCIARTVTYDVTLPGGTVSVQLLGLPTGPVILKPTAVITITNLEPKPIPALNHFHEYGNVFQPRKTITSPVQTTTTCSTGTSDYAYPTCQGEGFMNIGVECTNSTYP